MIKGNMPSKKAILRKLAETAAERDALLNTLKLALLYKIPNQTLELTFGERTTDTGGMLLQVALDSSGLYTLRLVHKDMEDPNKVGEASA